MGKLELTISNKPKQKLSINILQFKYYKTFLWKVEEFHGPELVRRNSIPAAQALAGIKKSTRLRVLFALIIFSGLTVARFIDVGFIGITVGVTARSADGWLAQFIGIAVFQFVYLVQVIGIGIFQATGNTMASRIAGMAFRLLVG